MKSGVVLAGLGLTAVTLFAVPCCASTVELGINGVADIGSNYIDFGQFPSGSPYAPAPGYGTFEVSICGPGGPPGVTPGEFGTIQSLNEGTGTVALSGPFMTFDAGGSNIQLWATNIPAGTAGMFVQTNTPDGAVLSFNVDGYAWNTSTKTKIANFTGTFSATFDGETVAQLSASLPIDTPFSASFMGTILPSVPEPASLIPMGAGLLGIALLGHKVRN